jgi:hypothetical protein
MWREMGNTVSRRTIEHRLLSVLAKQVWGYHMSVGYKPRANVADFETLLKTSIDCTKVWTTSDGGFDKEARRLAKITLKFV